MSCKIASVIGIAGRLFGGVTVGMAVGNILSHKILFVIGGLVLALACTFAEWKFSKC